MIYMYQPLLNGIHGIGSVYTALVVYPGYPGPPPPPPPRGSAPGSSRGSNGQLFKSFILDHLTKLYNNYSIDFSHANC